MDSLSGQSGLAALENIDLHAILQDAIEPVLFGEASHMRPMAGAMRKAWARMRDETASRTVAGIFGPWLAHPPFATLEQDRDATRDANAAATAITEFYQSFTRQRRPWAPELMVVALELLGVPRDLPEYRAAILVALAAETPLGNTYHNTVHMLEVMANQLYLLLVNSRLAANGAANSGTAIALSARERACQMIAAAAHDLLHDGLGNVAVDHMGMPVMIHAGGFSQPKRQRFRLEDISFHAARPWMEAAGMKETSIDAIHVMILATDAGGPNQEAKAAFAAHLGEKTSLVPGEGLEALGRDHKLALQAILLHEADILSSAGLGRDWNAIQTERLRGEMTLPDEDDAAAGGFITHVVGGRFASAAAKTLEPNLKDLMDWTEKSLATRTALQRAVNRAHSHDGEDDRDGKAV